jgi:hypothetical protein
MAKLEAATALLERESIRSTEVLAIGAFELPRGAISEVRGPAGRTGFLHASLAAATGRGEACAIVDWSGSFDPASAEANGVQLNNLLWVRANRHLDHVMTAADWILHAGGFGLVTLDLCEAQPEALRRIPLSWWHRLRLTVQHTPAILLVAADHPVTGSCAAASFTLEHARPIWTGSRHLPCLAGFEMQMNIQSRKSAGRATKVLEADWVGIG